MISDVETEPFHPSDQGIFDIGLTCEPSHFVRLSCLLVLFFLPFIQAGAVPPVPTTFMSSGIGKGFRELSLVIWNRQQI